MGLIVQKYGGTSVADAQALVRVARRVRATRERGHDVVVVVSAMGGATDDLLRLAAALSDDPAARELDALVSTGECVAVAALAIALCHQGVPARSFSGEQAGIITDECHGRARIVDVDPGRLRRTLEGGTVPVVAGFQGRSRVQGERTTLGRGGSDTTAVALAAALRADACEICTDVDGVYTADPRQVPGARKLDSVCYEEMIEFSAAGAKVLALSSMEYARRHQVLVHLRSSLPGSGHGTWIGGTAERPGVPELRLGPMPPAVTGVAHQSGFALCTLGGVSRRDAGLVRAALADSPLHLDMITYRSGEVSTDNGQLSFVLPDSEVEKARRALRMLLADDGIAELQATTSFGKLSLVGLGLGARPEAMARVLDALAGIDVPVAEFCIRPARMSALCPQERIVDAVIAVHDTFVADAVSSVRARHLLPASLGTRLKVSA